MATFALNCCMERANKEGKTNWQDTRYSYAISSFKTMIIESAAILQSSLDVVDKCVYITSISQGAGDAYTDARHVGRALPTN